MGHLKINKIAQGDVNIFIKSIDMFFSILIFFATLTGSDASNRLNIIIYAISRSILVEIDTSLALFQKNIFGGHFEFFRKRGPQYWQKLPTNLAEFK